MNTTGKLKTIDVRFDNSGRRYAYLTDQDAKVGDYAMVDGNGVIMAVEITGVRRTIDSKATKFAMAVVNEADHKERSRVLAQLRDLERDMEARIEELAKEDRLKRALAEDESGKRLLEERDALITKLQGEKVA